MYHSLVLLFKIRAEGKPSYLHEKLNKAFNYRTRLASTNAIKNEEKVSSDIRKDSFVPRTSNEWNSLPEILRRKKESQEVSAGIEEVDKEQCSNNLNSFPNIVTSIVTEVSKK